MRKETQKSIYAWHTEMFGPLINAMRGALRANEEMSELLTAINEKEDIGRGRRGDDLEVIEEAADVVINLYRLAEYLEVNLDEVIDATMEVNRNRKWIRCGDGTGHHVKETE